MKGLYKVEQVEMDLRAHPLKSTGIDIVDAYFSIC